MVEKCILKIIFYILSLVASALYLHQKKGKRLFNNFENMDKQDMNPNIINSEFNENNEIGNDKIEIFPTTSSSNHE